MNENELKPVKCGCGGEAEIDWVLEPSNCYMADVFCNRCGTNTIPFWSTEKDKAIDYAVTTWNTAMGATDTNVGDKERTAKVECRETKMGFTYRCCNCDNHIDNSCVKYCPQCGARLEWGHENL